MEANLREIPFGLDFHPSKELVAVSLITDDLHLPFTDTNIILRIPRYKDCWMFMLILSRVEQFGLSTGDNVQTRSEFSEDELTSVVVMKNGRKVICGSQSGTLLLYSWGFFKDCSDHFVDLSPNSVEALLRLDEDRLITGSENGLISLVGILPNIIIQPILEHSDYPVEGLAFSHDQRFLGNISHDQMLKLWDLNDILQGSENTVKGQVAMSDSDSDEMDVDGNPSQSMKGRKGKNTNKGAAFSSSNNFFADL